MSRYGTDGAPWCAYCMQGVTCLDDSCSMRAAAAHNREILAPRNEEKRQLRKLQTGVLDTIRECDMIIRVSHQDTAQVARIKDKLDALLLESAI